MATKETTNYDTREKMGKDGKVSPNEAYVFLLNKRIMTLEELRKSCNSLREECIKKELEMRHQYASERNPVKVGDIVTDHYHTIKVEKMSIGGISIPYMVYYGTELRKNGVPKKRQPILRDPVHQIHVQSINGQPYIFHKDGTEIN